MHELAALLNCWQLLANKLFLEAAAVAGCTSQLCTLMLLFSGAAAADATAKVGLFCRGGLFVASRLCYGFMYVDLISMNRALHLLFFHVQVSSSLQRRLERSVGSARSSSTQMLLRLWARSPSTSMTTTLTSCPSAGTRSTVQRGWVPSTSDGGLEFGWRPR